MTKQRVLEKVLLSKVGCLFSLQVISHHHNFQYVDNTRDIKPDLCSAFLLGGIARRIRTAMLG